jgi:fibronectin-binding autotransporter adhesin
MTRRLSLLTATLLLPLLLIALLFSATNIFAAVHYDICTAGFGSCTYTTIQDAVSDIVIPDGTVLDISPETFIENVEITRSISLVGAGPGLTIIDGQVADTVVLINGGTTVSLANLTIQNGDTTNAAGGGGILNQSSPVTLTNVIVQNNQAPNGAGISNGGYMSIDTVTVTNNIADDSVCTGCAGGGIYNTGVMTISNSFVFSNTGQFGGGIDNGNSGILSATNIEVYDNDAKNNPVIDGPSAGGGIENIGIITLTNSIVRNNIAPIGGGILNAGTLTMMGSNVYANNGSTQGGGLHNSFNATIQTSNFYDNQAGSDGGGGISSEGGTVLVEQTAVYNNSTFGSGGGIVHNVLFGSNSLTVRNSTISGNSATGAGGGVRNAGIANTTLQNVTLVNNTAVVNGQSINVFEGTLTTTNSIITTNSVSVNCNGTINSQGYNIASDDSCSLSGTADLSNTDPLLGALNNNGGSTLTHALLIGSPAIDNGSNCLTVDQRGVARPIGTTCDRGAYEYDTALQRLYLPFVIRP